MSTWQSAGNFTWKDTINTVSVEAHENALRLVYFLNIDMCYSMKDSEMIPHQH